MKNKTSLPIILTNIRLFGEDCERKEHQVIKTLVTGTYGTNEINALKSYEEVHNYVKNKRVDIGLIRIEMPGEINSACFIKFSRTFSDGRLHSFTMPLTAWLKTNQFLNNIIYIENRVLPLDGKTSIEVICPQKQTTIKLYLYPVSDGSASNDGDAAFNEFIDSDEMYYDYVSIRNESYDRKEFSLYFTEENGVETDIDPKDLVVTSNRRPYLPGDQVAIWTAAGNQATITQGIKIGNKPTEETDPTKDILWPIVQMNQFIPSIITGIDPAGRKVVDGNTPVYSYKLNSKAEVCFFVVRNKKTMPASNVLTSTVTIIGPSGPKHLGELIN